jgi:hypothetical protein
MEMMLFLVGLIASPTVETGALSMASPDWAFIVKVNRAPSRDSYTTMELMGINPFDAVSHEDGPEL